MTSEIKQRIEQINNGQVPEGYFRTTAGIIPQEWRISPLGSLLEFKNGVNADKGKYGSGIKMISVMDVLKNTPIHYNDIIGQVDIDENTLNTYCVNYGDILFQRSSETAEDAGKSNVYLDNEKTTYSGFVIRGKKKADYCPYFLNEALKKEEARKQLIRNAAGSQHINIGQESLEKIEVCLPSATEQEKIAEILMKWDKAIELQEKYIEKLKVKKDAIMHKLLVPKPNWKTIKLGDICKIKTGKLNVNDSCETGKYPFFSCSKDVYSIDSFSFDCEALLIAGNGDIGDIKYYKGKFDAYQRTYVLTDFSFDIQYVMQYLLFHFDKEILKGIQKSSMPYIKLNSLKTATIKYDENNYIQVQKYLFEFEKSIALSKTKLENLRLQRKALQQYLLNGIVRV